MTTSTTSTRTSLTLEEQARSQATQNQFKSLPYYRATSLEQASKRGAFTFTLEEKQTRKPCSVTVLSKGPLMMWPLEDSGHYLLMVGRFGEMALKVYLTPPLMANLYRATRPRWSYLELLGISLDDGRTTLTLKRGDGPAFAFTLEPDEDVRVSLAENKAGVVSAYCQVDTVTSDGKMRRRVLSASSEAEAVLEQVWSYKGYGPNPMRPRGAKPLDWAM